MTEENGKGLATDLEQGRLPTLPAKNLPCSLLQRSLGPSKLPSNLPGISNFDGIVQTSHVKVTWKGPPAQAMLDASSLGAPPGVLSRHQNSRALQQAAVYAKQLLRSNIALATGTVLWGLQQCAMP